MNPYESPTSDEPAPRSQPGWIGVLVEVAVALAIVLVLVALILPAVQAPRHAPRGSNAWVGEAKEAVKELFRAEKPGR